MMETVPNPLLNLTGLGVPNPLQPSGFCSPTSVASISGRDSPPETCFLNIDDSELLFGDIAFTTGDENVLFWSENKAKASCDAVAHLSASSGEREKEAVAATTAPNSSVVFTKTARRSNNAIALVPSSAAGYSFSAAASGSKDVSLISNMVSLAPTASPGVGGSVASLSPLGSSAQVVSATSVTPIPVTRKNKRKSRAGSDSAVNEQKKTQRRERNREHAKRSRVRKKSFMESLQQSADRLREENMKLRKAIHGHLGDERASAVIKAKFEAFDAFDASFPASSEAISDEMLRSVKELAVVALGSLGKNPLGTSYGT